MKINLMFASAAALALVAATPAYAAKSQDRQSAESDGGAAGAKAKGDRKTCRLFDNSVSRMKRERLCMTREQWKKFDEEQRGL
ncbi:MAG TPA: hypothetical protein VF759_08300 [Allosphingosinicella sp.]|jgi:hypothetical protein